MHLVNPLSQELPARNFSDADTKKNGDAERVGLVFTK
jgi:hypothetical protein